MSGVGGPKKPHSRELRARALAALFAGERPAVIARELGVPEGTVRTWKRRLKNGGSETLKKGADAYLEALVAEHLEETLKTLGEQARYLAKPEVLREIPTDQLAIQHGASVDRTLRMIELLPAVGVDPYDGIWE